MRVPQHLRTRPRQLEGQEATGGSNRGWSVRWQEEPRRAAVAEEAAGDGRINLAVARVSGKAEQSPQSGRRSGYSGKLRKGARVSRRRWPEMAGDRPAPGGGGGIAWAGGLVRVRSGEDK
jgi:hypothetical protein